MKRINLNIVVTLLVLPIFLNAQREEIFEIQANKIEVSDNLEIKAFKKKFNDWINKICKGTTEAIVNDLSMVDDFIIFSQDGLLMKDLNFHSAESCKKQILENLPENTENNWIYVNMESQVNKIDLIEILLFLKEQNIDYKFEYEDVFIPKILQK